MKVLIVDDEVELVETLVTRLRRRKFLATGVSNGQDALEELSRDSFDVVVIDVKMPGMSGLELHREIRARIPDQIVIMLTGHGSAEHAEEGLSLGAFDYLMKPIKLPVLIEILEAAASHQEGPGQ